MRVTGPWRRVVRGIVPVTVLSLVVGVGVIAALADGFPTKDVDLHDGGVWVTNGDEGLVGRFIVPAEELDAAVGVSSSSFTELDLLQEGRVVFLSTGTGALRRLDVVTVSLPEEGARIPVPAGIALGGGVVAVVDPTGGRLWVRPTATVDTLDTGTDTEDASVGGDAAVAVGRDGSVYAVSGDTDRLVTVRLTPDGVDVRTADLGVDVVQPSVTAVGGQPVVLSAGGRLVLPGTGEVVLPGSPEQVRLQQAGPASDVVAVATEDRLYGVPLGGGETEVLSEDGTGAPAAPVQVGGCIYAAWSTRPLMARACRGAPPVAPVELGATGLNADRLEFRVNYDLVVLNGINSGAVYMFDRAGKDLGNWENVKPPDLVEEPETDPAPDDVRPPHENTDPVAVDDELGARPGQATLLPVLDNDGDADGDFLVINSVSGAGEGARLSVIANGQALQLVLPAGAQGLLRFRYTVTDGRDGEDTALVSVTVRADGENTPPKPVAKPRTARVEQGGTVAFHVLTDWRDRDGDSLVLVSAVTDDPDAVRSTPDGFITFVDAGVSFGPKTVSVRISDGHGEPVEGAVTIDVLASGEPGRPEPRDDRVVGFVGETLTIEPLLNDIDPNVSAPGSSGPLRLSNVFPPPAGATLDGRDFQNGKILFVATQPRTYYLTYEVTQGNDVAEPARIRIDVQSASARNAPVAVGDTVLLRGNSAGVVDVLANDTDLDGDVLVVSSVSVPEKSGLVVSVLEHRWLRVSAPQSGVGDAPVQYTVSDGISTDVGVVAVRRVLVADNQPPSPRDDSAQVRVGDVVTIDVLANDADPEGGLLTLGPEIVADGDSKGRWYVTGGTVRYQAPATPGTAVAHYTVLDPEGREADGRITVTVNPDAANNQRPQPTTVQARVFTGTVTRVHIPLSGVDLDGDSVSLLGAVEAPGLGRVVKQGIDYLDYEAYPGKGGTDTFDYLVVDPFGATGTGTVRVGIIPQPVDNSAPVAVDDEYEVAPGATVNAPVLANDSDVDGDALQLEELTVANPDVGDAARVADNRIVVTAPAVPGESISVPYSVTDGRGLRSFATLRVVAIQGANVPPTAEDDHVTHFPAHATQVDVPVLDNDDDIDGPRTALTVDRIPDESGLAAEWDPELRVLRVELGDRPRQIAYRVTDEGGATAIAFVRVPPAGDQAPYVRDDAADISITAGTQQEVDLTQYIVDAEGQPIRVTASSGVSASPLPGLLVVEGSLAATSLTLQADGGYVGPATLVVEVTDGTGTTGGRSAALTLNVTVTPADGRFPTVICPPIEPRAGAPAIVVDRRTCVRGLTPPQRDALTFSDPQGGATGVSVVPEGARLRVAAAREAAPGTSGVLRFTIGGPWGDIDAEMTVRVQVASLAKANTDEIERADAGREIAVDVTRNDTNPFPGDRLRVLGVTVLDGIGDMEASVDGDEATVRIRPRDGYYGVALLEYTLQDALNQPDRVVQGRIIVHVIAPPDVPSAPRQVSVGANRAVVAWTAPEANGAAIEQYQLRDQFGDRRECRRSTTCEVTGLTNGTGYVFEVRARNVVDWSDWSPPSATITPDQRPDQPAAPTTEFGDGQITVRWTAPTSEGTPIREYTVERSPGGPDSERTVRAGTTSAVFPGLTNGASYTFRVRASNGAPNPSEWSPWSAPEVPAGVPAAPSAPTAAGVNDGIGEQMTVQWVPPLDNGAVITRYTLTVIRNGTAIDTIPVAGDVTSITVDVTNGVQYTFQVTATNKAGVSPASADSAPAIAHGRPDQVTSFSVSDHDAQNHGFNGAVQYSVTPPADNGMAISSYEFDVDGNGSPDRSYAGASGSVTGLSNGTNYQLRVRACNDMCGTWSAASPTVNPYGRPVAPQPTGSSSSESQITFNWGAPTSNGRSITSLEIYVPSFMSGWQTRPVQAGSYARNDFQPPGSTHTLRIRVTDSTGWVSDERVVGVTLQSPPPATLTVYRGLYRTPDADCSDQSCGWIYVRIENFAPNQTHTVVIHDNRTGVWGSFTATTNSSGYWEGDSGWFYGFPGSQVWVTSAGVTSPRYTWPP